MARFSYTKPSFLGGEVSPTVFGRVGSQVFEHGSREVRNAFASLDGSVWNRPGSQYLAGTLSNATAAVIPFVTSDGLYWRIEVTASKIRILNSSGSAQSFTYNGSGSATSQNHYFTITDLTDLQWAQSVDVMWFCHTSRQPGKLTYSDSTFDLANAASTYTGHPWYDANITSATLTPAATTGIAVQVTCSTTFPQQVGGYIWINHSGTVGYAVVTSLDGINSHIGYVDIIVAFGATTAQANWAKSKWTNSRGPSCAEFFEDRLCFAGQPIEPDTIDFSAVSSYGTMQRPLSGAGNDDADSVTLNSRQLHPIKWMVAKDRLAIGTAGEELTIESLATGSAGFGVLPRTSHGSQYVRPQKVFDTLLFVDKTGRAVREFIYSYETTSYVAKDIMRYAKHLVGLTGGVPGVIKQTAWDESRQMLWCVDDAGGLFSATFDRAEGVASWHRHQIGGTGGAGDGSPIVQSVCVGPASSGYSIVTLSISRTTDAGTLNTIEEIHDDFRFTDINNVAAIGVLSCVYVDCAKVSNTGSPVTSVSGLSHLNGETVAIVGDGYYLGTADVSGGSVTLPSAATQVVVGLPYRSLVEPFFGDLGMQIGSAQGARKRVDTIAVRLFNTLGMKFGPDEDNLESHEFRTDSMPMNSEIPFFTGQLVKPFPGSYAEDSSLVIVQDLPFPFRLASLCVRGDVNA